MVHFSPPASLNMKWSEVFDSTLSHFPKRLSPQGPITRWEAMLLSQWFLIGCRQACDHTAMHCYHAQRKHRLCFLNNILYIYSPEASGGFKLSVIFSSPLSSATGERARRFITTVCVCFQAEPAGLIIRSCLLFFALFSVSTWKNQRTAIQNSRAPSSEESTC